MRTWLIAIRKQRGLTQKEVSAMAGISRSMYSDIESGYRNARVEVAKRIGDTLGFDWQLFFAVDGRKTSQKKIV